MKKITAILTALTMAAALLAGCGAGNPAQTSSGAAAAPASSGAAGEGGDAKSVVVVFLQGLGDAGPMDAMNENLKKAQQDFGIEASTFEALEAAQHEEVLRTYAREGADLIITSMPATVEAVKKVAAEFPDTRFCSIFPLEEIDLPNVTCVDFSIWEAYYLAGIMGGSMSDTAKAGHVIGAEQSSLIANYNAFKQGAQSVNPDMQVLLSNTNTFDDPAKGKDAGISLVDQGCDILITDCAATGLGVIDAAKEKGILMMGDSNPHYELAPENILADTLCEYGPALYAQIERFVNGELESGTYYSSIREGGVGLLISPEIRGSLPADKQARFDEACEKIDQALAGIQSGELVIERNIEK